MNTTIKNPKVAAKIEAHRKAAYNAARTLNRRENLTVEDIQQASRALEAAGCYIRRNAVDRPWPEA